MHRFFALPLALAITATTASAQEADNLIDFRFGLGPGFGPGYFGADETEFKPGVKFQLEALRLGTLEAGGDETRYGLGFGASLRFIGGRDPADYAELTGLEAIDPSLELGGGLRFETPDYRLFADVRYGVVGHEAFVAELGGDLYYRPSDQWTLRAGPRVLLGDDTYAQTYFGVTADEALASAFDAYEAGAGLVSAGARAEATYAINDDWEVVGTLRYDRLQGDAAESPITQSEDQITGSVVLTRRITFGF